MRSDIRSVSPRSARLRRTFCAKTPTDTGRDPSLQEELSAPVVDQGRIQSTPVDFRLKCRSGPANNDRCRRNYRGRCVGTRPRHASTTTGGGICSSSVQRAAFIFSLISSHPTSFRVLTECAVKLDRPSSPGCDQSKRSNYRPCLIGRARSHGKLGRIQCHSVQMN